ncbi:unknown [Roseburia sp. CAG:380]|nr:unknown [Roseburia sp. CAG:380]
MGNRLYLTLIEKEGGFKKSLSVTGRAGADDTCTFRHHIVDLLDGLDRSLERAAVVVAVEGVQKTSVLTDHGNLCCGRTGINTEKQISSIRGKITLLHIILRVFLQEIVILCFVLKQRLQTGNLKFHVDLFG